MRAANTSTAEPCEPTTGKLVPTGSSNVIRTDAATATRLPDGRVLVTGGDDGSLARESLASADLYGVSVPPVVTGGTDVVRDSG